MKLDAKIYLAGHNGLVGSAIKNSLELQGYSNIICRTHKELDLTNQEEVKLFFQQEQPEYVFLAAAKVGGIIANNTYRGEFIYENLMIQNNVIHQSYVHKVKKLLFLGSTCIYPKSSPQPMKEECLLTSDLEYTNEPYAIAKIAGVKMCESYNLQYGTNFIAVQPTNLYGPNDNFDLEKSHVLPALIRKMHLASLLEKNDIEGLKIDLDKNPIEGVNSSSSESEVYKVLSRYGVTKSDKVRVEIWGSGQPRREFLWSLDMANACVHAMNNIDFSQLIINREEIRNTHLNIGTGEDISINDLAYLIKGKVGFKGELIFNTEKPDGTMKKLTDPSRFTSFGWKYKMTLEKGVELMYNWYTEV